MAGAGAVVRVFCCEPRHLAAGTALVIPYWEWEIFSLSVKHRSLLPDCRFLTAFLSYDSTFPLATSSLIHLI